MSFKILCTYYKVSHIALAQKFSKKSRYPWFQIYWGSQNLRWTSSFNKDQFFGEIHTRIFNRTRRLNRLRSRCVPVIGHLTGVIRSCNIHNKRSLNWKRVSGHLEIIFQQDFRTLWDVLISNWNSACSIFKVVHNRDSEKRGAQKYLQFKTFEDICIFEELLCWYQQAIFLNWTLARVSRQK